MSKPKMPVAYVAGPYRAETVDSIVRNIGQARQVARALWMKGYAVLCPHMNSALLDGACEDDVFLEGGLELLRRCDLLVTAGNWENSIGALTEIDVAGEIGLPVFYNIDDVPHAKDFNGRFDDDERLTHGAQLVIEDPSTGDRVWTTLTQITPDVFVLIANGSVNRWTDTQYKHGVTVGDIRKVIEMGDEKLVKVVLKDD